MNLSYLSPSGKMYTCSSYGHMELAMQICKELIGMKKQYSFEPSCNGNCEIFTYIDGAVENSKIVSLHDLSVCIYQLQKKGYEFCYSDGDYYRIKLEHDRIKKLIDNFFTYS